MELFPYYIGYIIILLASSVMGILLLIRIWGLRATPGAYGLMLSAACATEWSLTYAMEIFSADMSEKILWAKLQYFGISYIALGMFIFAMHYSGHSGWLTRTRTALLALISSVSLPLALTNERHSLLWTRIEFTNNLPFGPLSLQHGTLFYLEALFQYILIAVVTALFFQVTARSRSLYQSQARIMLIGMTFPWVANFMYLTGVNPISSLDLTPLALTLTNLFLSVSFLRYRFMDLRPIAQDSVFNAMHDGVVVLDEKERVIDVNPLGAFVFQDQSDLLGIQIQNLLPQWNDWRASNPDGEINEEIVMEFAGRPLTFKLRTAPVLDQSGRRNGRVLLISDITEQKQAHAQIMEASRLKSQLLANLGHDLRSPLGAIIGYAEMLKDGSFGPMSENQVKAASEILDGANQLLSFINNLVGQAQIDTGKIVLREYPFNVDEVVGPLLSTLNFHANKKGLALIEYIDPALPQRLVGDQFWLRQIVMNLVHNAVKFTEKGSVTVRFIKRDRHFWAIQVVDTGIGIPPEAQRRVFEAFEQVNSVESASQGGFGLGLSIVAKLTSIMNGRIELESEAGKGSAFTVILPLKEEEN
ncbi:MAG: PAS domain-containing protein [Chloroflexi bacterium]|nr:PAS domain-containing protein [Chloroflexota bacterium]MCA2000902.1 PAS domain-containing protein [Chloroflexota bacterium]